MKSMQAIGFDLFNTLITAEPHALKEALTRLAASLQRNGLPVDAVSFGQAHRQAALGFIAETRTTGRETHNRFWISAALETQGYQIAPDDPRISAAVDAYFSAFCELCHLIPGTAEMLETLRPRYRLGLLSNFTHAPAAWKILDALGLRKRFDAILISGELGYRKPHPVVFDRLMEELGVGPKELIYVGDDPEPDIDGACRSGIQPVWTTYVRDRDIPFAPGVATGQNAEPSCAVPRISDWVEFLALLDGGSPPDAARPADPCP